MSTLGTLCAAAAVELGIQDSERTGTMLRMACRQVIRANQHRELFWNVKQTTITPLVVGQYNYAQGATTSHLPQDWLAPVDYLSRSGEPTAWLTTTDDTDTIYDFVRVSPGEYRRMRAENAGQDSRPKFWTILDESLYIMPAADAVGYIIFLDYIYDASFSFSYGVDSTGAWTGSNNSYTDDWFNEEKGFHFLLQEVCAEMRATYMKDLQNAAGPAQAAAKQLLSLTSQADKNLSNRRMTWNW